MNVNCMKIKIHLMSSVLDENAYSVIFMEEIISNIDQNNDDLFVTLFPPVFDLHMIILFFIYRPYVWLN